VDVHALLEHVLSLCRSQMRVKQQRLALELRATRVYVHGDATRLQQVLWNLLGNATKFTPTGGQITVRTRNPDALSGDAGKATKRGKARTLVFEVEDTGVGISPEVLPRIFTPFEQGEKSTTRTYGGLGLGLTIARAFVEAHGGRIAARSEGSQRGTTMTVELPTIATPAAAKGPQPAAAPSRDGAVHHSILLVEDHVDTARILARLLTRHGHKVKTAGSIEEALRAAGENSFDLVLSDLGLPDGSGMDLIRQLRVINHGLRSVAISGLGMEEAIRRSLEAGFDAHVTKPLNFERLLTLISQLTPLPDEPAGTA
jgi:CheY-like chemotaxis protein